MCTLALVLAVVGLALAIVAVTAGALGFRSLRAHRRRT